MPTLPLVLGTQPAALTAEGKAISQGLQGASVRACRHFCRKGEPKQGKGAGVELGTVRNQKSAVPVGSWLSEHLPSSRYQAGERDLDSYCTLPGV